MTKKNWQKPQLIVLVRSKPDEMLLQACKGVGSGPNDFDAGCTAVPGCVPCDQYTDS